MKVNLIKLMMIDLVTLIELLGTLLGTLLATLAVAERRICAVQMAGRRLRIRMRIGLLIGKLIGVLVGVWIMVRIRDGAAREGGDRLLARVRRVRGAAGICTVGRTGVR